ncbi:MAG: hypothetical protein ACOCRO_11170 [Halanaerobiales bacterium]
MRKTKPPYYSQVVEELLLYREYKQRVLIILQDQESKLANNMGIDYDKITVNTSGISDITASTALDRLDEELENELKYKLDLVKKIEIAFKGLDPEEQFIIKNKYLTGRVAEDSEVYTRLDSPAGKTKYYEKKDSGVKKYAEIRGFIKKN